MTRKPDYRYQSGVTVAADVPPGAAAAFRGRLRSSGRHQVWTGMLGHQSVPLLAHRYVRYPAIRVAWALYYDRPPVGGVRASCGVPLCIAGPCLTDAAMRQREQVLMGTLLGVDLSGTCARGHVRAEHANVRSNGRVMCRTCDNDRRRAERAAEKEAAA